MPLKDNELENYYQLMFDLTTHDGWKELLKDLQEDLDLIKIDNIATVEDLFLAKGKKHVLQRLLDYRSNLEKAYADLEDRELLGEFDL